MSSKIALSAPSSIAVFSVFDIPLYFIIVEMLLALMTLVGAIAFGQTPQPFPQPGARTPSQPRTAPAAPPPSAPAPSQQPASPPPSTTPAPVTTAQAEGTPTEATLGVPIFPTAQFITSYNAGRGQRYYIFGSPAAFVELVAYYRTVPKQKGELVYDFPATHEFDVGKFNEDTMAFAPGVTVKDFESDMSKGYPNPKPDGQPARFPSIIQIVPVTGPR